jgi:S-adenosylmethionine:tRNA ribosyltransferase-isomerase
VRTEAFDYELPDDAIAQKPVEPRDAARLLVDQPEGEPLDRHVRDLPDLLRSGDLLVVNDTRVIPARLNLTKATGGRAEVLLAERTGLRTWTALVRPGRRLPPGTVLEHEGVPVVEVGEALADGERAVTVLGDEDPLALVGHIGAVPLPPYITEPLDDPERYQTVFADRPGSAAAPTAGLHLTDDVLERCRRQGVRVATVDLEVGLGTFAPIRADEVEDHVVHTERYVVPHETVAAVEAAERVVAVGTTVVRTLESWAATGATEGPTDLYVRRGHRFAKVDVLLTNFHVPRSSLLVLVDAFVGDRWRDLYATALARGYRFLSFGDAMLLERRASAERPG